MKRLENSLNRLPPQSIEAEQSVLGSILFENKAIMSVIEILRPDDFYRDAHRKIYITMCELYEKNEPTDLITITDLLRKKDHLEEVGGASYISMLVNNIATTANIETHAKIIKDKSTLRRLITSATEIVTMAYDEGIGSKELIDVAEAKMFSISEKLVRGSFIHAKDILRVTIEKLDNLYNKRELISGLPTGFADVDEYTTGFQDGDMVVVGARPGMGKTSFVLNIADYVGVENQEPVAIFSLEMTDEQLMMRMLCSRAEVDSKDARSGYYSKEDYRKLVNAAGRLAEGKIFIDDSFNSVLEMRAKARRLQSEHGLKLIIVDYLQLMTGESNRVNREQVISDISRGLKAIAKDLRVPLIVISQLNRSCELRGKDKRPMIADLRESGAIEQDADFILFLYRDDYYDKKVEPGRAELAIAKNRNGPTKTLELVWVKQHTKFRDIARGMF
jgi:replicative DNA helicase